MNFARTFCTLAVLSVTTLASAQSNAQQDSNQGQRQAGNQQRQPQQNQTTQQNSQGTNALDQHVATCLLLSNHEEIALAQFALKHAKHEKVKEFAQMLVDDHKKAVQKLERFSPQGARFAASLKMEMTSTTESKDNDKDQSRDQDRSQQSTQQETPTSAQDGQVRQVAHTENAGGQQSGTAMQQLLSLDKRATEECLAMTKMELKKHEGDKFDMAFIGSQMGSHIAMCAKLKASKEFTSSSLQAVLTECEQTTKMHKEKAEEIKKELKEAKESTNK